MNRYRNRNEAQEAIEKAINDVVNLLGGLERGAFDSDIIIPSLIKAFDKLLEGASYIHSEKYASPQGTIPRPSYTDYDNDFLPFTVPEEIKRIAKRLAKIRNKRINENIDVNRFIEYVRELIEWMQEDAGECFEGIRRDFGRLIDSINWCRLFESFQ